MKLKPGKDSLKDTTLPLTEAKKQLHPNRKTGSYRRFRTFSIKNGCDVQKETKLRLIKNQAGLQ